MPLFEYQCLRCGRIFEVFTQRREPTTMPECPGCGEPDVPGAVGPVTLLDRWIVAGDVPLKY